MTNRITDIQQHQVCVESEPVKLEQLTIDICIPIFLYQN